MTTERGARHLTVLSTAPGPKRVQLRRTKGWRMPAGARSVARPTRWGNPFTMEHGEASATGTMFGRTVGFYDANRPLVYDLPLRYRLTAADVVTLYRDELLRWLNADHDDPGDPGIQARRLELGAALEQLRGLDLACWCKLGQPCHADVLLELANRPERWAA